jgi:hypothetical protein
MFNYSLDSINLIHLSKVSVNDVKKDEYLTLQLKDGTLRVKVEEIKYGK